MKLITLTLLILASTAFSVSVENSNDLHDAIEYSSQLTLTPGEESTKLAEEFKQSLPKLEKIKRGLIRDGLIRSAKGLNITIRYAKKASDPNFVFENKAQAKFMIILVRKMIEMEKKYLEDEELFVSSSNDDKKSKLEELREKLIDLEKKLKENGHDHRAYIVRHYLNALNGLLKRLENNDLNDKMFDNFVERAENLLEKYHKEM